MSSRPAPVTAVSAPGKVLLTGGYLVLDRAYSGTVFALDARIHVVVQQLQREPSEDREESVVVRSPQFRGAVWEYGIRRCERGGGVQVTQRNDGPKNPFVETSLNYALTYIGYVAHSQDIGSLSVTILADNDYYSDPGQATDQRREQSQFRDFGVALQEAHKTGLGSSAALVTALVSALVVHRTMHPDDLIIARPKLHNLAQAAHCAAQGKIGSGFDVAAAVYGSCFYRRFSPTVLERIGEVGSPGFDERLFSTVEDLDREHPWDAECVDVGIKLPPGVQMVLCDVDCGSETPSMVRKVLEWRKQHRAEADALWDELQSNNDKLRYELRRLHHHHHRRRDPDEEAAARDTIRELLGRARRLLRSMTEKSGVPIEPRVQTELLDRVSELEGVIGGVVPGAGGYDAVALLVRDEPRVYKQLEDFLAGYRSTVEDDFGGRIERVRMLGVRQGPEGVRVESDLEHYVAWL